LEPSRLTIREQLLLLTGEVHTGRESAAGEVLRVRRPKKEDRRERDMPVLLGPSSRLSAGIPCCAYFIFLTFDALGPFGPFTTSNSTLWPSDKDLKPSL